MKVITLRLSDDLASKLAERKQFTLVPTEAFIRSAINLALFADDQSANRNASKREPIQYALRQETR